MLLLVGFRPTSGASLVLSQSDTDSLPLRRGVELTTDAQKLALISHDRQGAKALLLQSIAEDSTYAPAYYLLTRIYSQESEKSDSLMIFARQAYLLDSLNSYYTDSYILSLALSNQLAEARRLCLKSIERKPQDMHAYEVMVMLYRQSKMPLAAISIIDSAEVRNGKNEYLSSEKRNLLLSTGQVERAIREAVVDTENEPRNIVKHLILAQLYAFDDRDSLALAQCRRAHEIDSTSVEVMQTLSQFQVTNGDYEGYLATLRTLFDSDEESVENKILCFKQITSDNDFYGRYLLNINMLAMSLWRQYSDDKRIVELYTKHLIAIGKLDDALEIFKERTRLRPALYDDFDNVINIEMYKQHTDSVELYTSRALELFPERYELHLTRANLLYNTKQHKQAIKSYEKILNKMPSDSLRSLVMCYIGDNYQQLSLEAKPASIRARSMMRKVHKSYDKGLEYHADNALILNNYAYYLSLEKRDLERALNMSGRAIELVPKNPTYMDTYGWILYELGRYSEAKKILKQVVALDTTQSSEIPFHYAEILAALGENFMAEIYYEKAAKAGYNKDVIEYKISQIK